MFWIMLQIVGCIVLGLIAVVSLFFGVAFSVGFIAAFKKLFKKPNPKQSADRSNWKIV